jgi:Mg-chelatase subunit ChlD
MYSSLRTQPVRSALSDSVAVFRQVLAWSLLLTSALVLLAAPASAQQEDEGAIPYETLKARAETDASPSIHEAKETLEAVVRGTGDLENGKFDISISVRFDATDAQLTEFENTFEAASQLLYDATDGQHQFGEILVCNDSRGGRSADIWIQPGGGRAHAHIEGLGEENEHVTLYAQDDFGDNGVANTPTGTTIVHEWGHYAYGIYDEYIGPNGNTAECQQPPYNSMGSLMENFWEREISEFCVASNHDVDDPTTPQNEANTTDQEAQRGESSWETMTSTFPSLNAPNNLPNQAPPNGHDPITWRELEAETRISLVLDESGSMAGSRIQNARRGGKLFVDLAQSQDKLGVVSYDSNVQTVYSLQQVQGNRANIRSAIDQITAGGSTNIGGGLRSGLGQITGAGDEACQQVIILLTDGMHNTGENPLDVIPDLQTNNVTVHAVALGADANTQLLRDVADQTNGRFFAASGPGDLNRIFAELESETTDNGGVITAAQAPVSPGQTITKSVTVEPGIQETTFLTSWNQSADVGLELVTPNGATITPSTASSSAEVDYRSTSNSVFYTVRDTLSGDWTMRVTGNANNAESVDVDIQASGVNSKVSVQSAPDRPSVDFPDPIRIKANVSAPIPVTGADVSATVERPDGTTVTIPLSDDGNGADKRAFDGVYTSTFDRYNENGAYDVRVTSSTVNVDARLLRAEALFSEEARAGNLDQAEPRGPSDTPAPSFERSESFSVNVGNVPDVLITPPDSLKINAPKLDTVQVRWTPVDLSILQQYFIYRDTSPIAPNASLTPIDTVAASDTSYTDDAVTAGQTYYYRVKAVDTNGFESDFSDQVSAFLYPKEVTAAVDRAFGDATDAGDYRLVALPGDVDRLMGETVSGEAGTDWQAYWDDGSANDFLQKYDGSDTFRFRAGRGFWLTSTEPWSVSETVPTVALTGDTAAVIDLHDGWNIISNPTGKAVPFATIQRAYQDALQPLWPFDGAFSAPADTMQSARSGVAYYFNNRTGLDSLAIPYPGAPVAGTATISSAQTVGPRKQGSGMRSTSELLSLSARPTRGNASPASVVRVGIVEMDRAPQSPRTVVAPPGRFESVSLRIKAPDAAQSKRNRFLMVERRPPASPSEAASQGHTFPLQLTNQAQTPVRIEWRNLDALQGREAKLIRPATGQSYDLRSRERLVLKSADSTALRLAIGTKAYVEGEEKNALPSDVDLRSYPNPARQQATVEYALPESGPVRLVLYDVLGRRVAVLADGRREAGRHRVQLDASDLSSGVYFGRLRVGERVVTRKITIVR